MAIGPLRWTFPWTGRAPARERGEVLDEIDEELAHHLELATRDGVAVGLDHDEARAQAMQRFGDLTRIRRACERQRLPGERLMWKTFTVLASVAALWTTFEWRAEVRAKSVAIEQLKEALAAAESARGVAAPVARDWIQVGDLVQLRNLGGSSGYDGAARVQRDGQVLLRDAGWLRIEDLSLAEARDRLNEVYTPYLMSAPNFTVELLEARADRVEPVEAIVVKPFDVLTVIDETHPEDFCGDVRVERDGTAFLPQLGSVPVAGKTRAELESFLSSKLVDYFIEPPTVRVIVTGG